MTLRLIGSVLVILGCGGFGFAMASSYHREVKCLRQFVRILEYLMCELQYRQTPLPQLCRQAAMETDNILHKVFLAFADELDMQLSADAEICMKAAVSRCADIPQLTKSFLLLLGHSLGRFDLNGQLQDLEQLRQECGQKLARFEANKAARVRTYQTLGLCAGAALAILLI